MFVFFYTMKRNVQHMFYTLTHIQDVDTLVNTLVDNLVSPEN